ncbi:hypothetical protein OS493_014951 [Desmophyllum pertusum]|uniref:TIR domain-containing protein n=1 Tax=Desmophyllum pertusum TaxID=174260 RepID=A0A9X0A2R8_9CNID|nr:hypothetical protein OS493_014951 [Desmophyllum pertusum]
MKVSAQQDITPGHCSFVYNQCYVTRIFTSFTNSFETANGGPFPNENVVCRLESKKTRHQSCVVDISKFLKTLTSNDVMIYEFILDCLTPMKIVFNNSLNATKKNAMLYLQIMGRCGVSADDIFSHWGKATDFRFLNVNASLIEGNKTMGNDSRRVLENIGVIFGFDKSKQKSIPSVFRKYVWQRMGKISFSGLQLTSIPAELKTTMPLLQSLDISYNNLAKPPPFPWCNATLQLPGGLRRTLPGIREYQFNTDVHPNLYRRYFDLSFNNIEDLSTHEFRGFLDKITLKGNGVKVIGPSSFRNLKGIQVIDLSKNMLNYLPWQLFQGQNSLLELRLDHNNISVIPSDIFKDLTRIKRIDLNHNKLSHIPKELFNTLNNVEILHLENNEITRMDDEAFIIKSSSLRRIYLQNNKISRIPGSLLYLLLLQQNAIEIDLSSNQLTFQDLNNFIDLFPIEPLDGSFPIEVKPVTKHVSFANNNFTTIDIEVFNRTEKGTFEFLMWLSEIDMTGNTLLCDCKMFAFAHWLRALVQRDASIQERQFKTWKCAAPIELKDKPILSIELDQFLCQKNLENCPKECSCSERAFDGTLIIDCKGRNLSHVPPKVRRCHIELRLENNNIREIPPYPYMENVTALYLTHNNIQVLNESTVQKFKRIEILFIDWNELTGLPRNIENINFTSLALHHNFFKCDCTTKWMKHWLQREGRRVEGINNVLCQSGNAMGKTIYTLPDEKFVCKQSKEENSGTQSIIKETTFRIIALTLGASLVLTFIVVFLVFKYRMEMKVYMYTHFNWHPFDRIDDSDPNKIYDAFVSYSGNDYQWVVNTLQERLENHDPPYKLCVHHRDFLVGAPIQENILNSVDQSKRMLMVLSQNFVRSEWCLLEFRAAHRKVLQERMNYLIIILFDDVDMAELDDEMKLYMRTNTYLSVSNKWFWEKLCYAMPQTPRVREFRARNLSSTSSNAEYSTETAPMNETLV